MQVRQKANYEESYLGHYWKQEQAKIGHCALAVVQNPMQDLGKAPDSMDDGEAQVQPTPPQAQLQDGGRLQLIALQELLIASRLQGQLGWDFHHVQVVMATRVVAQEVVAKVVVAPYSTVPSAWNLRTAQA